MKTILFLANGTIALYRFRKELIAELVKQGNQVTVSSPNDGLLDELLALGITFIDTPVDRHGTNPKTDFALLRRYRQMIRDVKPDVILGYTIKPNIYGNLAAKGTGIPMISNVTGLGETFIKKSIVNQLVKALYRYAFRKTDHITVQNREDEAILRQERVLHRQQLLLLPGSGVNLEEFPFHPLPSALPLCFLYSGRLMASKGIRELLEAAKRLEHSHPDAFVLCLAGYFDDDLEQEIQSAQGNCIRYLGFQKDIQTRIQESHCIVLPSYKEGMSNSLLEAAAMGRPLITTDASGCREVVDDGVNGYLCKPRDADSLYDCMRRFLELEPAARIAMGKAGREKVERQFDRNIVVKTMMDLVDQVTYREDANV